MTESLDNKRLKQHLDIVTYFAKSIFRKNSINDVLWDIVTNCIENLGFVDCIIYLIDFERNILVQKAAYGDKNDNGLTVLNPIEIPLGQGIVGQVAATGIPENIGDTSKDPRYIVDDDIRYSELTVPIFFDNKVIGVIDSEHPDKYFYESFHLEVLLDLATISGTKIATTINKKERDELERLMMGNPNPVFRVSKAFKILLSSNSAKEIINVLNEFTDQEQYQQLYYHVEQSLDKHQTIRTTLPLKDHVYSVEIIPFTENGYADLYLENITDYVKAKEEAEQLTQAKTEFISVMSHEIRTPLNGILNLSRLLKGDETDSSRLEMYDAIEYSGKNLLSIISDILEFEKLESGNVVFQKDIFSVHELAQNIHKLMQPAAIQKSIELILDIDEHIPATIIGDEMRLMQIMNNLISNAIKFTDKGYVRIDVKLIETDNTHASIRIDVKDTGVGIKENEIEFVFAKFKQTRSIGKKAYQGSGLGLNITKKLIEQQGGSISLTSTPNIGSCFSIQLHFEIHEKSTDEQQHIDIESIDLSDVNVLIVDDSPINIYVAEKFLRQWNVITHTAESGLEAIELCNKHKFDTILMDIQMPGLDGYETTNKIRNKCKKNNHTPIILMSADVVNKHKEKMKSLDIKHHISKPFEPELLKETIYTLTSSAH